MCEGFDLMQLKSKIGSPVYCAAQHGAGVYDFLVFSEVVPKYSKVTISVSRPLLLREKHHDSNISTISLSSLLQLFIHRYSIFELYNIVKLNISPEQMFRTFIPTLNPKDDSAQTIKRIQTIYSKKPYYLDNKIDLYYYALNKLIEKKCQVTLIYFPNQDVMYSIEAGSSYKDDLLKFDEQLVRLVPKIEVIELKSSQYLFADLTHLNSHGSSLLTTAVAEKIKGNESMIIKVKINK